MKHIRTWSAAFVAAALAIPAAAQNGNAANAVWMDAPLGGAIDGRPAVMPPQYRRRSNSGWGQVWPDFTDPSLALTTRRLPFGKGRSFDAPLPK